MQVAVETRRVLFPCGRVAQVVVGERLTRKGGVVRKFVQGATVEAMSLVDAFAEAARQSADYVDLVVASVRTPAKPITVVTRPQHKLPYSHGTVCGGTSVKKTNREERSNYDSSRKYWREYWNKKGKDSSWKATGRLKYRIGFLVGKLP